jgi:hypothetical protein
VSKTFIEERIASPINILGKLDVQCRRLKFDPYL